MSVAVIGGGLAGSVTALELAADGVDVVLFEREAKPMASTSRFNEGKVHLGYVYANDPTGRTAGLMQEGALEFSPILARHLGDSLAAVPVSGAFEYVVHPETQVPEPQLRRRYASISAALAKRQRNHIPGAYLGALEPDAGTWRTCDRTPLRVPVPPVAAAIFASNERAIEPFALADAVEAALEASQIDLRCGIAVTAIETSGRGYHLRGGQGNVGDFEAVVNASWGSRLLLDRSIGIVDSTAWNHRFKYFLRVRKDGVGNDLPNRTWAVGPFGDVVTYGDDLAYLSWYPSGRRHWGRGQDPPWRSPTPARRDAREIADGILSGLAQLLPAISTIDPNRDDIDVMGGLILGNGNTDITDPASGLHRRDRIGVTTVGNYHSIATGKFTTAPQLGRRAARGVVGTLG